MGVQDGARKHGGLYDLVVDDILLIGNDVGLLLSVKIWLSTSFQMKDLGKAQYILGIKVFTDCKNRKLVLSQATFINKLLVKHVMQDSSFSRSVS